MTLGAFLVWTIAAATIAAIVIRPKRWPEAVWACLGAATLLLFRLLSPRLAFGAVAKGDNVYLFLTGMMLLSEMARREGVFDWLASLAVHAAHASPARLFALIYGVGILVTVFLSNDATAVVLTPAVYAAVKKARTEPLPYLFACAFIANAASFVLPISNPANLVVYGRHLPALMPWLRLYALPSLCSVAATFFVLRWRFLRQLSGVLPSGVAASPAVLSDSGRRAAWGLVGTGAILIAASAFGLDLGPPTCAAALVAVVVAARAKPAPLLAVVRHVSWNVLPLVAGLFVLVEALDGAGALADIGSFLHRIAALPAWAGSLAASFGVTALSSVMNNLPAGLLTGAAIQAHPPPASLQRALLIGVDLGPNLSVSGSLATVLWLIALRREGIQVSAWTFLKMGALVMPPALLMATLALLFPWG